MHRRVIWDCCH